MAATGQPNQIADYADRRLVAQRVDGIVQLRDEPAGAGGRRYLIEPDVGSMSELRALADDYVATAERIDDIPMLRCWF